MLKIIEGGFNSLIASMTEDLIRDAVENKKRTYLIVPEQQTLTLEKWAAKNLPASAPLSFEVTNFTRLADSVFRELGGLAPERLTAPKRALLLWRALHDLAPMLTLTAAGATITAETVGAQLRALNEAEALALTPELLQKASELAIGEGRLGAKTADLAKIMARYNELLENKYTDSAKELSLLRKKLADNPGHLSDVCFLISDFTSFTDTQHHVITELARRSDVTVFLGIPTGGRELFEYMELNQTHKRLVRDAAESGIAASLEKAKINSASTKPLLDEALMLLWRQSGKIDNDCLQNTDNLRVFEASDTYDECDFVMADITKKVMAGGRYSDFAVIVRDTESYADILSRSAESAGVPLFISTKRDVASFEAIKLIYTAFSVIMNGFSRRDVITYAKCSLSGIERERCDELELYAEKWQLTGRAFTNGVAWNMNPDGYTERQRGKSAEMLIRVNETRDAIVNPLLSFYEAVSASSTAEEYSAALENFLVLIHLEESLMKQSQELLQMGESTAAKDTQALYRMICDSLDAIVEVMGKERLSAREYLEILKTVFSSSNIGRIPSFADEVLAGSADMLRPKDKKHVYLLGVNYGSFPGSGKSTSYFSERDIMVLRSLKWNLSPEDGESRDSESELNCAKELYYFSRSFASAKESVTITYHRLNSAFKDAIPADVIKRISDISGEKISAKRIEKLEPLLRIYTPEMALSLVNDAGEQKEELRRALVESGYGDELYRSECGASNSDFRLTSAGVSKLYGSAMNLTQARIDAFVGCPFNYFCKYNLSLSDNERAEFNALNVGTFIHAILENFFYEIKKSGSSFAEIDEATKRRIVESVSKKHLTAVVGEEIRSSRLTVMISRLLRAAMPVVDSLCREFSNCGFEPKFFELKIERGNGALPAPATFEIPGGTALVYGTIDRVDAYKPEGSDDVYVRVVDYKTGKKDFSPKDIESGQNLQMLLYLKAITETDSSEFKEKMGVSGNGRLIPAAVVYTRASVADQKLDSPSAEAELIAKGATNEMSGMMLSDEVAINAMNPDFLPVKMKKGSLPENDPRIFTLDGWDELSRTLGEVVSKIAQDIKSGNVAARPMKRKGVRSNCEYCKYKPICRSAE